MPPQPPTTPSGVPTPDTLKALLKTLGSAAPTPAQVHDLAAALSPDAGTDAQALALLCLSTAVATSDAAGGAPDAQAARIKSLFDPLVADAIASGSTDPGALVPPVSLLAALAPLAPAGTVALLTQPLDGVEASGEAVDPLAVLLEFAELPSALQPALAALVSALAGTKAGRELVRDRALEWTTAAAENDKVQGDTAVLATVALSKLGREDPVVGESEGDRAVRDGESEETEERLATALAAHVSRGASGAALLPTLEGLSVLSTRPAVRDVLAADAKFLSALVALSPVPQAKGGSLPVTPRSSVSLEADPEAPVEAALCYGLVTILQNLSARRAVLSEHDAQMARLRRMAIAGKTAAAGDDNDPHEDDAAVLARVEALYKAGVVGSLRGLVRAESPRIRATLGKLCLNLVEERAHRAVFVRDGGFRVLSIVIRDLTAKKDAAGVPDAVLPASQALTKLVISTPPNLLFPPPHQTNALSALPPLFLLLVHPSATLLQTFESLMALTNLASIDPAFGDRIMSAEVALPSSNEFRGQGRDDKPVRIVARVEELLLDDNALVRRAATELVCNLVNSDAGFRYFAGEPAPGKPEPEGGAGRAASRLAILLLLTDADDTPTRLAAGGALAVLTDSAAACAPLVAGTGMPAGSKRSVWDRIADLFEPGGAPPALDEHGDRIPALSSQPPDPALVHRGVFVALNLLNYVDELPSEEGGPQLARAAKALKEPLAALQKSLGPDPNGVAPHIQHMIAVLSKA
ncbi:SWI5-dependent HO expression protein 4 [Vanrija albida]|uniref:SWI5-dependent HO expression protein 4 n=1 Tax=Vanrija albida TaxID=181172 RepID=A0ABR3PZ01_9TREE